MASGWRPEAAAGGPHPRPRRPLLDQRTALLHELDHRVKNNLQLISSLMLVQARHAAPTRR